MSIAEIMNLARSMEESQSFQIEEARGRRAKEMESFRLNKTSGLHTASKTKKQKRKLKNKSKRENR